MRHTYIKLRVDSFDFELFKETMKEYKKKKKYDCGLSDIDMFTYYLSVISVMAKYKPENKSVKDVIENNPDKFPIRGDIFADQLEYALDKNKVIKSGHIINVTHNQVIAKDTLPECKSAIHIIYDEFKYNFNRKMEFDPPWGPRDWACAKYLLLKFDIESIKSMIAVFFDKADRNTVKEGFPFVGGYNSFYNRVNSLYADVKSPERNTQKNSSGYRDMTISRYKETCELDKLKSMSNITGKNQ